MKVGSNLKALRKRKKLSQEDVAQALTMHRSTYSGYENDVALPNIENLISFSQFHELLIDDLVKLDFQTFTEQDWLKFENKWKDTAKGSNLRVLTSVVDSNNEELIELIPEKARAGYVSGYSDQEFIQDLPRINLPFLSRERKHRAFAINGDSMPPLPSGSIVIGEFIQDWTTLKTGTPSIVVTKSEGIVFKFVHNNLKENKSLVLISSNPQYQPFSVSATDILEVWKFSAYISKEIPEVQLDAQQLNLNFRNLQYDVQRILEKLNAVN
jgi:transcriptional regulator with XRE-family HTH domain